MSLEMSQSLVTHEGIEPTHSFIRKQSKTSFGNLLVSSGLVERDKDDTTAFKVLKVSSEIARFIQDVGTLLDHACSSNGVFVPGCHLGMIQSLVARFPYSKAQRLYPFMWHALIIVGDDLSGGGTVPSSCLCLPGGSSQ